MFGDVWGFEIVVDTQRGWLYTLLWRARERHTIAILSYADSDLLVSGLVVLTSGTSVSTFSFIHFSHFVLRIFGAFGLSSSAYVELIVPVFSTKRIFLRDTFSRSDPHNQLEPHILFYFLWIISSSQLFSSFLQTPADIMSKRGNLRQVICCWLHLVLSHMCRINAMLYTQFLSLYGL